VNEGQASWEAFGFQPKAEKKNPAVDVVPQLDKYGFPVDNETSDLLRDGDATLRECLEVSKPYDYVITSSDPRAVKTSDGDYCMQDSLP
jgi:transcription factor C subunit 3